MDVHAPFAITAALRRRGVDVLISQEDNSAEMEDADLLDRTTSAGRVLFTRDEDLLAEGVRRQRADIPFAGIIYAHQLRVTIGQCVRDLKLMARVFDPADMANRIEYLPLK